MNYNLSNILTQILLTFCDRCSAQGLLKSITNSLSLPVHGLQRRPLLSM